MIAKSYILLFYIVFLFFILISNTYAVTINFSEKEKNYNNENYKINNNINVTLSKIFNVLTNISIFLIIHSRNRHFILLKLIASIMLSTLALLFISYV